MKILILGAGFGGTYTLINLHKYFHNEKGVQINLVNNENYFLFTPLLHEVATGSIDQAHIVQPIRKITSCCLDEFILSEVKEIDLEKRIVKTNSHSLDYDYLVIALGATTNYYNIEGAKENTIALKNLNDAKTIKNKIINVLELANSEKDLEIRDQLLTFTIIGGGATGVEIASEISDYIYNTFSKVYKNKTLIDKIKINLISSDINLVKQFNKTISKKTKDRLEKLNIKIYENAKVLKIENNTVYLSNNTSIKSQTIIWAAGVIANNLKFTTQVDKSLTNRLIVKKTLQLKNYPKVFALGDIAEIENSPSPMLAQIAVNQANVVAKNIFYDYKNKKLITYKTKIKGLFLSLGKGYALGQINKFTFSGFLAWFMWRTIYLLKMNSTAKKIKIALDWTLNIFADRDLTKIN